MAAMLRAFGSESSVTHVKRLTSARAGSSTASSPSSIALARTTSSSAVSSATLPISLRYIRTGSSMPMRSAASASRSSSPSLVLAVALPAAAGDDLVRLFLVRLADQGRLVGGVEDLDPGLLGRRVQLLEGAHLRLGLRDRLEDLVVGDEALFAAPRDQVRDRRADALPSDPSPFGERLRAAGRPAGAFAPRLRGLRLRRLASGIGFALGRLRGRHGCGGLRRLAVAFGAALTGADRLRGAPSPWPHSSRLALPWHLRGGSRLGGARPSSRRLGLPRARLGIAVAFAAAGLAAARLRLRLRRAFVVGLLAWPVFVSWWSSPRSAPPLASQPRPALSSLSPAARALASAPGTVVPAHGCRWMSRRPRRRG